MNAHARHFVPDGWSCEYEFERLDLVIDGMCFAEVDGTAELAPDPSYAFCVTTITLDGWKRTGFHVEKVSRKIDRPGADDQSEAAVLFRMVETALDNSRAAVDFFQSEVEAA